MLKKYSSIWIAALINLLFFIVFFTFFYPIYDSKEDAYAAYLLSGSFGNQPTAFLHYNYGFHPLITILIKNLFLLTDRINWYSMALIAGHYLSSTVILSLLMKKSKNFINLACYTALFLIFEGFFLILLDFSGTSVVVACSGLIYLLVKSQDGKLTIRHCIAGGLLLLLASFYRIHTIIPLAGIAVPFFVLLTTRKEVIRIFSTLVCAAGCILLFNFFHRAYYTAKDPGWPQEEASRQKVFSLYNFHTAALYQIKPGEKWYTESQLLSRGLLIDSSFLKGVWLDSMYHDLSTIRPAEKELPAGWTKWFFINNRVFFCITLLMLVLYTTAKRIRITLAITLLLLAASVYYLANNAKLPPYVLSSALYFICLASLFTGAINPRLTGTKTGKTAIIAVLGLFAVWGIIRAYKTSQQNKWQNYRFKSVYKELASNKDKLFIITKDFPIHKFYAFDVPRKYMLENYTDTEHFIIDLYEPVFKRFGISTNKDIPYLFNILFWGEPSDAVRLYFEKITGQSMKIITLPQFRQETVWRVVPN